MAESSIVVLAARLALVGIWMVCAGCTASSDVTLSADRGVCMKLPPGAEYRAEMPGPDYEIGAMKLAGVDVEFLIGGHPRFSHDVVLTGLQATAGFTVLGKERSDELDKVLFAHNRGERQGPIYVMAMARDLSKVESALLRPGLLFDCR